MRRRNHTIRKIAPPAVKTTAEMFAAVERTVRVPRSSVTSPRWLLTATAVGKVPVDRAIARNVIVSPGGSIVATVLHDVPASGHLVSPAGKRSFGDDTSTLTRTG